MTDSLNFGPEWLRNLSSEGTTSSSGSGGGTKYQLAEHRYGREEMLALFERGLRAPELLANFSALYVEHSQLPLAFTPMTEDEIRLWQARPPPPSTTRGGRGGSLERGRGRGRGATFHQGYSRSSSGYEEVGSRSYSSEHRSWSERNGGSITESSNDWGSIPIGNSPRKELSRAGSADNWRRHRNDEEIDGWRTSGSNHRIPSATEKWVRGTSWRDGDPIEERYERSIISGRGSRTSWHSTGDGNHTRVGTHRRPWDQSNSVEDRLPEWATENPGETGSAGSFDATGAFLGSDEDRRMKERPLQKSASQHSLPDGRTTSTLHTTQSTHSVDTEQTIEQQINPQHDDLAQIVSPSLPDKKAILSKTGANRTSQTVILTSRRTSSTSDASENEKSDVSDDSKPSTEESPQSFVESLTKDESPTNEKTNIDKKPIIRKILVEELSENNKNHSNSNGLSKLDISNNTKQKNDDEMDRMKEVADDLVAKLVLDEETPNKTSAPAPMDFLRLNTNDSKSIPLFGHLHSSILPASINNPSILGPTVPTVPGQDKWFYRDPQGDVQGPFLSSDMTDWYRAGYFSLSLLLRRQCDERFYTLGDLVKSCGTPPFTASSQLPPLKAIETTVPVPGLKPTNPAPVDPLRFQQMHLQSLQQQMMMRSAMAVQALSQTEPWGCLSHIQQKELIENHMLTQPQIVPESTFITSLAANQNQTNNPLMQMINQIQGNKLTAQHLNDTKPSAQPIPTPQPSLDPLQQLIQQMGGLQSSQPPMPVAPLVNQSQPAGIGTSDGHSNASMENDPVKNFLRQFSTQQQTPHVDSFWSQGPFPSPQGWLGGNGQPPTAPTSLWTEVCDNTSLQQQTTISQARQSQTNTIQQTPEESTINQEQEVAKQKQQEQLKQEESERRKREELKNQQYQEEEKRKQEKREMEEKEAARKREQEASEKLRLQKEAEEKRKEEQRKEAERKQEAERQRKEAERIRKEAEKAKREADEKRMRELEERRRLKEQRKQEEEAKRKAEEERKRIEEEEKKKEQERRSQEEQAKRQADALRKMQETQQQQRARAAPWCQPASVGNNSTGITPSSGPTLAEIQRAEKERRAAEVALQQQAKALKEAQEQQAAVEKSAIQLKWASKVAATPKKVKSLAEIQAEEQEKLAKQAAEARLTHQKEKKETVTQSVGGIWGSASQCLTWGQNSGGFWEDSAPKSISKPVAVTKSTSAISINAKSQQKNVPNVTNNNNNNNSNSKNKTKTGAGKDQHDQKNVLKLFDNAGIDLDDEFSNWCTKTLTVINGGVHIPTFVGFLLDIESPYEVKDYVRTYLGEGSAAGDFARQFLERRSRARQRHRAALQHTDDMCVPAPAVNPSSHLPPNNTEFTEVKSKNKKVKKSKMLKVDSRILGFSVTSAQDRINVGDRDYGDNV